MDEKKYTVCGTVTIGTDEYRDLIEDCIKNETSASEYRNKYWAEQEETKKLRQELNGLKKKLEQYEQYLGATNSFDSYSLWVIKKQSQNHAEE